VPIIARPGDDIRRGTTHVYVPGRYDDDFIAAPTPSSIAHLVSLSTVHRTLRAWGWSVRHRYAGYLQDEHERPDVVAYRNAMMLKFGTYRHRICKRYTPEALERLRAGPADGVEWTEDEQAVMGVKLGKVGGVQEKVMLLIVQDESACNANPVANKHYHKDGITNVGEKTQPKGKGPGCMITGHISGFGNVWSEMMRTGKQHGWFTSGLFLANVDRMLEALAADFPSYSAGFMEPLCVYDNSGVHRKMANDSLQASKLNKHDMAPKRKEPTVIRSTYLRVNPDGSRAGNSPPLNLMRPVAEGGGPRGMVWILSKRGLDRDAHGHEYSGPEYNVDEVRAVLSAQPDFLHEPTELQTRYADRAVMMFWPRFHAELSPIEMGWGLAKRRMNSFLNGQATVLMDAFRKCWSDLSPLLFASWYRRCERFMVCYDVGMDANLAYRLINIMTGRGGGGGSHVAHLRIGASVGGVVLEGGRGLETIAEEEVEDEEAEPALAGQMRGTARSRCLHCTLRIKRKTEAYCECCQGVFHPDCLTREAVTGDADEGEEEVQVIDTWLVCDPCSAFNADSLAAVPLPQAAEDDAAEAQVGNEPAASLPSVTDEQVERFYAYFSHGMGGREASDRRFPHVKERLRTFIQRAAAVMGAAGYSCGKQDLIATVCAEGAVPSHFWYEEPE
jgi:hypothetical protein